MIGRTKRILLEKIAKFNKKTFSQWQKLQSDNLFKDTERLKKLNVVSFSGSKYLLDQLLSIYSFYLNVGIPTSWTVFNDGSYTKKEIVFLQKIPNLLVSNIEINLKDSLLNKVLEDYKIFKKIYAYSSFEMENRTTIFVDSDVLFFPAFSNFIASIKRGNWYNEDENNGYFDPDFNNEKVNKPLNSGLLIFNTTPNWEIAKSYLEAKIKSGNFSYWTEQTAFQIMAIMDPTFKPLPQNYFVVGGRDAFNFSHCVNYKEIATRHFVGPVRHKMWQYSWRKSLNLK